MAETESNSPPFVDGSRRLNLSDISTEFYLRRLLTVARGCWCRRKIMGMAMGESGSARTLAQFPLRIGARVGSGDLRFVS
jgi:hypothetical protein